MQGVAINPFTIRSGLLRYSRVSATPGAWLCMLPLFNARMIVTLEELKVNSMKQGFSVVECFGMKGERK